MADLLTPNLELPYANPDDPLGGAAASMGALALALDAMLGAQTQFSDASFPVAASGATSETVLDRFTIAAVDYPRRVICLGMVLATYTQSAELDLLWYADTFVIGRSRRLHVASAAADRFCIGLGEIPATEGLVCELRINKNTGTGTWSTSISSGLTKAVVLSIPAV
jgi:hypothetical protein